MILARGRMFNLAASAAALFAVLPSQAQADVLELDAEGARWVAGGPVVAATPQPPKVLASPSLQSNLEGVVSDPRLHALGIPPVFVAKVGELSQRYALSPALIEALVWQESRWRNDVVSHAGARGLTQLMPGTARYLGVDPNDPMQNLEGGARYLREQLDRFDGNLEKALAAYNAGPGRVIKAGGIPNIRETQNYVAAIMARLASHSRPAASQ